jgi:reactive chlorine resistance protein C
MDQRLRMIGTHVTRYGLVVVLLWIGGMKFTTYEAEGIKPMVANSPLMGWVYGVMSVTAFSALLGVIEIAIAALIAVRPVWPVGSAVGSGLAVGMFLTTFSFLFTTPGWEPSLGGFPAVSAMPGQFVLKDIVLLGVALWTAGEALSAARTGRAAASAAEPGASPDRRGTSLSKSGSPPSPAGR